MLDRALQTPKRGIGIATLIVALVGVLVIIWAISPSERRRSSLVGRLEVGDTVARVVDLLGPPPLRCSGDSLGHLETSFPPGWPAASTQTTLQQLSGETSERWVYPVNPRRSGECAASDGQTEIGVGADGRLVWFIAITGKTILRFPARYSPADPEGAAGS